MVKWITVIGKYPPKKHNSAYLKELSESPQHDRKRSTYVGFKLVIFVIHKGPFH